MKTQTVKPKAKSKGKNFDFHIQGSGTTFILCPLTQKAKDWTKKNICYESWQMFGDGVAIESRYVGDIIDGIKGNGMSIQ